MTRRRFGRGDGRDPRGPAPLRDSLEVVLGSLGGPGIDAIVTVHERWDEIVGEEVAALSRPLSIDDGVLRIRVSGPAWASHLRWAEREILARIDALVGPDVITSLVVSVGRLRPGGD